MSQSINQIVQSAIEQCQTPANQGRLILDLDEKFFCESSKATATEKIEAVSTLLEIFVAEGGAKGSEGESGSVEEQRHIPVAKEESDAELAAQGLSVFQIAERRTKKLTPRYVAGILLLDLLRYSWERHNFQSDLLQLVTAKILELSFEDYSLRNLQAHILAHLIDHQISMYDVDSEQFSQGFQSLFGPIAEKISEGEFESADLGFRVIRFFLQNAEDKDGGVGMRNMYHMVPIVMPSLFEAFTNGDIENKIHAREQILHLFYLLIRLVAWADGIDNELVQSCLGETFQSWMGLFLQLIQSNPKKYFNMKKNVLKCLVVIFRDFINFSKDSINLILKPAWKLLNSHLPVFTEVVAYNQTLQADEEEEDEQDEDYEVGNESFEEGEIYGVEGMTFHLLELLSTLVQRPNVQGLVMQGLVPLVTTVSSYLLIQFNHELKHVGDPTFFIADKSQELLKVETIRSQCLVLISSLIEVFGDAAVQAILLVVQNIFSSLQMGTNQQLPQAQANPATVQQEEQKQIPGSQAMVGGESGLAPEQEQAIKEAAEFKALLEELIYISKHPKNIWKRREVAILILGTFVEDISMFMIRNPKYDLLEGLFGEILETDFDKVPKSLRGCLIGRSIWCANQVCDLVPKNEPGEQFKRTIIDLAVFYLCSSDEVSIKLIATRCLIKYTRRFKEEELKLFEQKFEKILEPLLNLLDKAPLDCVSLPIEAISAFSKLNEKQIAAMSPRVTPKLLTLFKNHHSEGALGQELIALFKKWCNFTECREIFVETFIPFIMEILEQYYQSTPNCENKTSSMSLADGLANLALQEECKGEKGNQAPDNNQVITVVDASILSHVLDLLCSLLKNSKSEEDRAKIVTVFPDILKYVEKSDDMFLLLNGTQTLKTFIHLAHKQVLELSTPEQIITVCKKLLSPETNEQSALMLGNLVIQVIHKVQPRIDTMLLMCVVKKIYKSRMPSIVQSLVLIFARLIHTNTDAIIQFLSETSIENRICLKIVLDKWLLQQALFRGNYTRTVTISALCKMFMMREPTIETLMVIGYNPSHSNINSEVNAPFKMLSLMLRFLENETKPTKLRPIRQPVDFDPEEDGKQGNERSAFGGGGFGNYKMQKQKEDLMEVPEDSGQRMDTMGGEDSYGEDYGGERRDLGGLGEDDRLEVNMDDLEDDDSEENDGAINLGNKSGEKEKKKTEQLEKNKEETKAEEELNNSNGSGSGGSGSGGESELAKMSTGNSSGGTSEKNLFAIGESHDKGLADMETGSEVYMSELLAGFDMDDFDEAEEMNEEDLISLGDEFAKIDLVNFVKNSLNSFILNEDKGSQYIFYCAKKLPAEDKLLAKKFLNFPKDFPPLE